jgi:hypothetical protein
MNATFQAKHGTITSSNISLAPDASVAHAESDKIAKAMVGKKVHEIEDWKEVLLETEAFKNRDHAVRLSNWFNRLFGVR